ncbi:MAG: HNH endonuclease signature motif containing protein [Sideroxydans sp.]
MPPRKVWTESEIDLLKSRYPNERAEDIATELGVKMCVLYAKAKRLGLCKSEAFKSSPASGRLDGVKGGSTRFQKGRVSHNKGKKGISYPGGVATQFKKGMTPHNHLPVGTTVMATIGYFKTKVAEPNKWKFTHHMKWEEVNGPIPKGMMLEFIDRNRENCDVSNLLLVTKQEHMQRYTIHNYPPELRQLMNLSGAITRKIKRRLKNERTNPAAE